MSENLNWEKIPDNRALRVCGWSIGRSSATQKSGYRRHFFAKPVESDVGSGFHPAAGFLAGVLRSVATRRASAHTR
jgi:hypothetical protein